MFGFGGKNILLLLTWISALGGAALLALAFEGRSRQFFGIAGSREQSISFQYPVEIVQIAVVEGQEVEQTAPLVEVRRYDLVSELAIIEDKITEIKSRHREALAATRAELESLRAQQQTSLVELDTQIESLEARHRLNLNFIRDISGVDVDKQHKSVSPMLTELSGLRAKRRHVKQSLQAKIDNLEDQLQADARPADSQVAELEKRKTELQRQAADLNVSATFDGCIGGVLYKPGEQVPPFEPILTLYSSSPSFIKGYIYEALLNDVRVGQRVWICSNGTAGRKQAVQGEVESLGSRIVEYPERLKKNPMVNPWGREVIIRLEDRNPFLLGEKALVFLEKPKSMGERIDSATQNFVDFYTGSDKPESLRGWVSAIVGVFIDIYREIKQSEWIRRWVDRVAGTLSLSHVGSTDGWAAPETTPITTPLKKVDSARIEASGITWDKDNNTYLLVSDETTAPGPVLYEMNRRGQLLSTLPIAGTGKFDDLESISTDGKYFYVASSLSYSKKGRLESKRRKFVRLLRVGKNLEAEGEIDLYNILRELSRKPTIDQATRAYLSRGIGHKSLDIEAHAVVDNVLYLGFKNPLDQEGRAVILKIIGVNALFEDDTIGDAEIWQTLTLLDPNSGRPALLSDMVIQDGQLFLLGVVTYRGRPSSFLWNYSLETKKLRRLSAFPDLKAEGLSIIRELDETMVVFDGGGDEPSRYTILPSLTLLRSDNDEQP